MNAQPSYHKQVLIFKQTHLKQAAQGYNLGSEPERAAEGASWQGGNKIVEAIMSKDHSTKYQPKTQLTALYTCLLRCFQNKRRKLPLRGLVNISPVVKQEEKPKKRRRKWPLRGWVNLSGDGLE